MPDELKVTPDENPWITAFMGGGVNVISPDETPLDPDEPSGAPLNCALARTDLIITDFVDVSAVTDQAPMDWRLWRIPVGVEGMPLFRRRVG